ncbi:hypothetical protein LUZ62_072494 [Rhynchospora pubera]|uniref:Protein kinase domain-containing protein n=1 Tax=Rhynchospora pubera TaxID=906938 RepID=A0AAV8D277_9POAL|nr:hypothetical protein LUZ62_072494 [Rhynchospora pubera]
MKSTFSLPKRLEKEDRVMSSQFDRPSNNKRNSNIDFSPKPPPLYMPSQNPQQILNYSFQTGEEFALEFIQERANVRPQFVSKNKNVIQSQGPIMSPSGQKRQLSDNIIFKMENVTELASPKILGLPEPEKNASRSVKGSSRMFQQPVTGYNLSKQNVIKFLCSFGGKFLPRPSDGKIRYVGGETYILQLRTDISWKELIQKTMGLLNMAHTIKYHLPGEHLNVLILVSCDEDVHHMMEECIVLQDCEEKPRLFLFSSQDDEEDNEIHSNDTDSEARFVAAVNAVTSKGYTNVDPGRDVGNNEIISRRHAGYLDQLIFEMDSDSTNYSDSYSGSSFATPVKNATYMQNYIGEIAIPARKPSYKHSVTNQEYVAGYSGGSGKLQMPSSVPTEFRFKNKSRSVPSQKELSSVDESRIQLNFEIKENVDSKYLLPKSGVKATSSDENFFGSIGTSRLGYSKSKDDLTSLSYLNSPRDDLFSTNSNTDNAIQSSKSTLEDAKLIAVGQVEPKVSVQEPVKRPTASFDRKQRELGSHEVTNIDEIIGERNSILRQKTIERSDPKNSIISKELSAIKWHDDMAISTRELSKGDISVETPMISRPVNSDSKISEHKKDSTVTIREEESRKKRTDSVSPRYYAQVVDNASMRNEGNNIQVRHLSQEDIRSVRLDSSEHEDFEQEHEPSLPAFDSLGRELDLSNVQIIRNEDLEDLRVLGSGAFGTVYHGRWRGTDVAIKRIKKSCFTYQSSLTDKLLEEFWREAAILSKLHHPNVLAFYGVVKDGPGGSLATVTEFMVSGSLRTVLLRRDRYLDQRKRIMLAMDAAIGMEYLHAKNIVHFDLKCDNLLVNLKDLSRPICKVADFGLSKMKETTMVSGGMRGTLPWMAPEQLSMSSNKVSEKIDVYSFGIVMWEILTGEEPYSGMHYGQVIVGILNNTLRPTVPASCDPNWKKLMEQCWAADPDQRPSFTEIASCLRSMLEACLAQPTV